MPAKWDLGSLSLAWLRNLAEHEPATWHSRFSPDDRIELCRFLRSYSGIDALPVIRTVTPLT
jgi:hypothetical protein